MLLVPTVLSSRKIRCRLAPKVRVNTLKVFSNINRDAQCSWPEPNLDAVLLATCEGVESTSSRVEILTVRTRMADLGTTAFVEVVVGVAIHRSCGSASGLVSDQRSEMAGGSTGSPTQFGTCPPAWRIQEGCATKSGSVRLRERPAVVIVSAQ